MNRQPFSSEREIIVAGAIREVVTELRMIDVADYIGFIRMERFASVADLVETAAELYLMPGTLKLGHGGDIKATWEDPPQIMLDLELHAEGATVFFVLTLAASTASVDVNYIAFRDASADPMENNRRLEAALDRARIRKTEPLTQ